MDKTWITSARRFSAAYVEGVENFMNFIRAEYGGPKSDVLCTCSSCMNSVTRPQSTVQNHLHLYGMSVTYTRWVHHGEAVNVSRPICDPIQEELEGPTKDRAAY